MLTQRLSAKPLEPRILILSVLAEFYGDIVGPQGERVCNVRLEALDIAQQRGKSPNVTAAPVDGPRVHIAKAEAVRTDRVGHDILHKDLGDAVALKLTVSVPLLNPLGPKRGRQKQVDSWCSQVGHLVVVAVVGNVAIRIDKIQRPGSGCHLWFDSCSEASQIGKPGQHPIEDVQVVFAANNFGLVIENGEVC